VSRIPDRIEPAQGWRVWDVVLLDGTPRLCSLAFWSIWIPGRAVQATCRRAPLEGVVAGLPPHDAPAEACRCGIYATARLAETLAYSREVGRRRDTVHRVVGRVSLWGTVIECEGGWRSALGYPAALFVPGLRRRRWRVGPTGAGLPVEDIAVGLAAYGVPVELLDASDDGELLEVLEPRRPVR
jgi:hypothetical protein